MRERLFRGDAFEHDRTRREDFDPIAEGTRYGLAPEVSVALWEHVRRDTTNSDGVCDENAARARFAQLAERIARRGGQLGPEPFHWTQIDVAWGHLPPDNLLAERVPGRTTLVLAEASPRARVALGVPGRTTLVAQHVASDVGSLEESRGFFRRYLNGGHAARTKLEGAFAARDHYAAVVAVGALKQDLASARRHLANGLEGDEGLRSGLAALEGPAEQQLARLPNMSAGDRPWERGGPTSVEWGVAIDDAAERADGLPQAGTRLDEPRAPQRLSASLQDGMERAYGRQFDEEAKDTDEAPERSAPPGAVAVAQAMHRSLAPPREDPATLWPAGDRLGRLFRSSLTRIARPDGEHGTPQPAPPQDDRQIGPRSGIRDADAHVAADGGRRLQPGADVPAHLLAATAAPASTVAVMRSAERAEVEPEAAALVAQAHHDGTPLDEPTRSRLEASLGRSLGHVRVHTGADADSAARALGARAFAIGPDLFFRDGAYDPSSRDGRHLIAHEVAHAVQAPDAAVASAEGLAVSQPGDAREREAESFAERFVHAPEHGDASTPITHAEPPRADASPAPFAIHQRADSAIFLAREDAPGAPSAAPAPAPRPGARPAGLPNPTPASAPGPAPSPAPGPSATPALARVHAATPAPTRAPAATPAPAAAPTPAAPASVHAPSPGASPEPTATHRPGASPAATVAPAPNATPAATSASPGMTSGAAPAGASGDFAARIQTAVAAQHQVVTAKASEVKGTLATAFTGERQKLLTGFEHLVTRMDAARDKALADLTTRAEAAKTRVRNAATAEHAKLEQALGRQQQAVRQAGDTASQAAIQQATAQGDRVQQGAASRAQRARTIGSQWASKFESLDGGASTASDIRSKANDLASKIESGASEGGQTCLDHGQKIATDIRKDARDVASGMSDKLKDARTRIDKDRDDAIKSIDDGVKSARDGITQSFAQTRQQVEQKKGDAGTGYDQLRAGAIAQVDTGLAQVLGKLDAVGQQMQTDVTGMIDGAKQYAVAPEVTAELNAGIGRTVAQYETKLGQLGAHGASAFVGVRTDASAAATHQTSTILAGMDGAMTGLQTNLSGKIDRAASKIDESATAAITDMQSLTPKAEGDLQHGVTKGQGEWNKQLTDKIGTLSGRVDSILSQQDSQLSKLDSDLGSQYTDAKQKSDDAKRDKHWYESAWDAVKSGVSAAFEFVGGLIVGFFEAAWELLKGLWEMLKTPLGWLLLAIVVILAVIVVVLFGWEALIIAGVIIGLCMAAYYVYLAVTTPGLTPYERGKLFGKALFNVVLAFVGVELEGSNLLRFTQWGGLIPQAIRLVQEAGSIGEAIQLVRAVGSIKTALQLVEALGSVEQVVQLVQEAGGASKLIALIDRVGGVENLLRLIANPKIGDVSTLVHLLENAKIGNAAALERLLANAKIADVATLERLLANAKIADAASLERLLGNAKIADVATLERLLGNAKIADAATLERLLGNAKIAEVATLERLLANAKITDAAALERLLANAKIADVATLERLLGNAKIADVATLERLLNNAKIPDVTTLERLLANARVPDVATLERLLAEVKVADAATLERLLNHAKVADAAQLLKLLDNIDSVVRLLRMLDIGTMPSGAKLLEFLEKAGGAGNAALLEDLLKLAKSGNVLDAQQLLDRAAGNAANFRLYATWAMRLAARTAGPTYAAPPQVAAHGFTIQANNLLHFLDHTWEFCRLGTRAGKPRTTFWPPGTTPSQIADELGRALDGLNPAGGHAHPIPGAGGEPWGNVHVGTVNAAGGPRIGMFYPTVGETIMPDIMQALIALLGP